MAVDRWSSIEADEWERPSRWESGPRLHSAHYLYEVVEGRLTCQDLVARRQYRAGTVFFRPRGTRYWLSTGPSSCRLRLVRIRLGAFGLHIPADAEAWELLMALTRHAHLGGSTLRQSPSQRSAVRHAVQRILDEQDVDRAGRLVIVKAACMEAVVALARALPADSRRQHRGPTADYSRIRTVIERIEGRFHEPLGIAALAAIAGLGRSQFHAVFRGYTGLTVIDYLTRVRIGEACRLLRQDDTKLIVVASRCGFGSLSRFYEAFHKVAGVSPGKWSRGHVQRGLADDPRSAHP